LGARFSNHVTDGFIDKEHTTQIQVDDGILAGRILEDPGETFLKPLTQVAKLRGDLDAIFG
jgi:hypothetical protein